MDVILYVGFSEEFWKIEPSNLEKQVPPNVATSVGQGQV